jgi:putative FmdB family regulatory protein
VPRYDYDCAACGSRSELVHGVDADPPTACPVCGSGPLKKAFAPPTIHFKGSGWAKKERNAGSASAARARDGEPAAAGDAKDASKVAGSGSTKGDGTDPKKPARSGESGGGSGSSSRDGSSSGSTSGSTSGSESGSKASAPSVPSTSGTSAG